jgi:hypothetical protein
VAEPLAPPWFTAYLNRGFRLVKYPQRQKGPTGPDAVNWPAKYITTPDGYVPDSNWGVLLGTEISPGRFLVDIDFDWPTGLPLAKKILPNTSFAFGRGTRTISHSFYTTNTAIASRKFDDIDGTTLVELRGTKKNGSIGLQTMLPKSIHPNEEVIELRADGEITFAENIERRVVLYAVGCLFLKHLGVHGLTHEVRLAIAGFLLSEGLAEAEAIAVGQAIAEASGNDSTDVELTVRTTAGRVRSHEHVKGKQSLTKAFGDSGRAIVARVREWLGGGVWIEDAKTGKPIPNHQENIRRALDKLGAVLSYDAFAQRKTLTYGNYSGLFDDKWFKTIWLEIEKQFHFRPTIEYFQTVLDVTAFEREFHPVIDYLAGLTWDKVPRLDTWLITYGGAADTEYVRSISAMVLIAAVRRVRKPGCKFDELLVLESGQGKLKSSALRALCPDESWFSDDFPLDVDAKEVIERTLGKWIIEAGELAGMRGSQVESLKAMLSRAVDGPIRMAYGRESIERARQFIAIGTTNSEVYLKDTTGNRRYWPIRVKSFDLAGLIAIRDQLWAEASAREAKGESIRLATSLYGHAALQQERRRADDPWEVKLEERFERNKAQRLVPDDVWNTIGIAIDRRDEKANERILKIMTRLGFRRATVAVKDEQGRDTGKRTKGFAREQQEGQTELGWDGEHE